MTRADYGPKERTLFRRTKRRSNALRHGWSVSVAWEPRDIWLGLYWTRWASFIGTPPKRRHRKWFVCVVPCLPIIVNRWEDLR